MSFHFHHSPIALIILIITQNISYVHSCSDFANMKTMWKPASNAKWYPLCKNGPPAVGRKVILLVGGNAPKPL